MESALGFLYRDAMTTHHAYRAAADAAHSIDARGLKCPLPVLKTRRALLAAAAGARIEVLCTDPVSVIDIPHLVREMGCKLESSTELDGVYRFVIVAANPSRLR